MVVKINIKYFIHLVLGISKKEGAKIIQYLHLHCDVHYSFKANTQARILKQKIADTRKHLLLLDILYLCR